MRKRKWGGGKREGVGRAKEKPVDDWKMYLFVASLEWPR
jgi:hypothetical protein